jgi:hypothetical protein
VKNTIDFDESLGDTMEKFSLFMRAQVNPAFNYVRMWYLNFLSRKPTGAPPVYFRKLNPSN